VDFIDDDLAQPGGTLNFGELELDFVDDFLPIS
jgi:hypothetical protein